jgi:hypothetical protein
MQMPKRHASEPSSLRVTAEEKGRREEVHALHPLLPSPWTLDEDSWRDLGPVCRILISLVRDRALEKFSYFLTRLR